ncbi:MAG: methionyl-tRNA formyltransferase [Planctomycetaceae bacterium]
MRVVLMGTGEFALPAFRAVLGSEHQVVAVVTQPDKSGRGHHQHVNVVKSLGESAGVPVLQPERVNRPEVLEELRRFCADVFLVASYGQILKPELLSIPRLGAFNLHGSLLPKYRGAAPVQYSIWEGERTTGVTIFQIEPALDSGPMVGKVETEIGEEETSGELMLRLAELCVPLTLEVLDQLSRGVVHFESQDPAGVVLAPKIPREAGQLDFRQGVRRIDCQLRALQPWPKCSAVLLREGQEPLRCLLLLGKRWAGGEPGGEPGGVGVVRVCDGRPVVRCGDGWLEILRVQPEGRRAMDGRSFVNGTAGPGGAVFADPHQDS